MPQTVASSVRDPDQLVDELRLPEEMRAAAHRSAELFPLLAPRSFLDRIEPADPHDPLLAQILPVAAEEDSVSGFVADPVGDSAARRAPGLLQKYRGRALLITTGACAIHCRYCFRRSYPYSEEPRRMEDWEPAFAEIESDPTLHEIILSGGDPLMLTDARLAELCERIAAIPHITRLRIHTRLPIVKPERITDQLIELFRDCGPTPIMVVHSNHARELVGDCAHTLRRLVRAGITVLNQAVLLRGVNDSVAALAELCGTLVDLGVMPYYLHQLDRVAGAAHFEVPEETGLRLVDELRRLLPGYAVPQYVREVPGEESKLPVVGQNTPWRAGVREPPGPVVVEST